MRMSNAPNTPSSNIPPVPPYWSNDQDWIVMIEFLRSDDEEDRARVAESIGYLFAYAQKTNTRMLALVGSAKDEVYELLFSFDTPANKAEFLRLMQSNDATRCEEEDILVPRQDEIEQAQPIARVLPPDVLQQVATIAVTLDDGSSSAVN